MSDGDEASEETADAAEEADTDGTEDGAGDDQTYDLDRETFDSRLDEARSALDEAETESELDDVDQTLDAIGADLEQADLEESEDEEVEDPDDRLATLREDLEAERGPYADDVVTEIETVQESLRETRWTDTGVDDLQDVVATFVSAVAETVEEELDVPDGEVDTLATGLDPVAEAITAADLDPDTDAEKIERLVEAAETLSGGLEDAEEWDDLSVRSKLQAEGFYESLGGKYKDFPPEWSALRAWENEGNVEMILTALDRFDSDFMERHCLEALERMGDPAAIDTVLGLAERRDQHAIRILGEIGEPRETVVETLADFLGPDADPALERVTLKALGQMGATGGVQAVADRLLADDAAVRSSAARSLGLIGDPRAVAPLETVLEDDDVDSVRGSAAWALVQIGTDAALEAASPYADDQSYVVQTEAEPAVAALG